MSCILPARRGGGRSNNQIIVDLRDARRGSRDFLGPPFGFRSIDKAAELHLAVQDRHAHLSTFYDRIGIKSGLDTSCGLLVLGISFRSLASTGYGTPGGERERDES